MTTSPASVDHSKIITVAAKDVLGPLGYKPKGRSLLWFADHGWWVSLVEFQPNAFSKGSYINVGAMWLWAGQKTLAFHDGYRVESFQEFKTEYQLLVAAQKLALSASLQAQSFQKRFSSLQKAAIYLAHKKKKTEWDYYHAAVSSALTGKFDYAKMQLDELAALENKSLKAKAMKFAQSLASQETVREVVAEDIAQARTGLKLAAIAMENLWN